MPESKKSTNPGSDSGRVYHTACTGAALATAQAHEREEDITLFGSCFCPFVQRVWVAFEVLGVPYKYEDEEAIKEEALTRKLAALQKMMTVDTLGLVAGGTRAKDKAKAKNRGR
ncbi:hypothetical protein CVT25_013630 [Psilocybe cyanescens]|uniref:GST N-terminal domain-containing protein n=1 Tax=Psilocybe cyanescens TaxID=93625 RepID=A0A409W5K6_PSICY|nr:hypothetical protein CVT25_013630 [Psilocybe cyanescens]